VNQLNYKINFKN